MILTLRQGQESLFHYMLLIVWYLGTKYDVCACNSCEIYYILLTDRERDLLIYTPSRQARGINRHGRVSSQTIMFLFHKQSNRQQTKQKFNQVDRQTDIHTQMQTRTPTATILRIIYLGQILISF